MIQPGLDGLYHDFLKRMKDEDEDRCNREYLPILQMLSITFESLTESELAFLSGVRNPSLHQDLDELKPFIQEMQMNKEQGIEKKSYTLYHQSLIDFFRQEHCLLDENGIKVNIENEFWISEEDVHRNLIMKYYDISIDKFKNNLLQGYGLRYIPDHLLAMINYNDYQGIDWYKQLIGLVKDDNFEIKLRECFPYQIDLSFDNIKKGFLASIMKKDPLATSEMLLIYSKKIARVYGNFITSVLTNIRSNRESASTLEKVWRIVDRDDSETKVVRYLYIIWYLDKINKKKEAQQTLQELSKMKDFPVNNWLNQINNLISSMVYCYEIDTLALFDLLSDETIYRNCTCFLKQKDFIESS